MNGLPVPDTGSSARDRIQAELRYVVFLPAEALATVQTIVARYGGTVDPMPDAHRTLATIMSSEGDCLVIDPSLITPTMAEMIAITLAEFPRPVIAFCRITTRALKSAAILAQRTQVRFIFSGLSAERSALERALLLTPDMRLLAALHSRIDAHMARLPSVARDWLGEMFLTGNGTDSLDALATAAALTRRSLNRRLAEAGFVSGKRVLDATRAVAAYRAITRSRVPLYNIARMLGWTMREMDAQFVLMIGVSCGVLRAEPMPVDEVVDRVVRRLTERER